MDSASSPSCLFCEIEEEEEEEIMNWQQKTAYSMKEYPTKRPACEKKAIIIKLTCPNILVILSAPYKNGTLLNVPTVMVIPIRINSIVRKRGIQFSIPETYQVDNLELQVPSNIKTRSFQ